MYYEEPRTPALPGEENVTDGSVDDYGTDWENVDNGALEEEMAKCAATPCDAKPPARITTRSKPMHRCTK